MLQRVRDYLERHSLSPADLILVEYEGSRYLFLSDPPDHPTLIDRYAPFRSWQGALLDEDSAQFRLRRRVSSRDVDWDATESLWRRLDRFGPPIPVSSRRLIEHFVLRTKLLTEAKRKVAGNLCVNTGSGSGGGFTACNVGADTMSAPTLSPDLERKIARQAPGRGGEIKLSADELDQVIRHSDFALMSAGPNADVPSHAGMTLRENRVLASLFFTALPGTLDEMVERDRSLRSDLTDLGYRFVRGKGQYGHREPSLFIFVPQASEADAVNLGRRFEQQSIIHARSGDRGPESRMIYLTGENRGTSHRGTGFAYTPNAKDYFTEIRTTDGKRVRWTLNFAFDRSFTELYEALCRFSLR